MIRWVASHLHPTAALITLRVSSAIVSAPTIVAAQPSASPTVTQGDVPASSEQPPIITFAPEGLGVLEAVHLALKHNPSVQLAEQDMRQRAGEAQEQRGAFDLTLDALASYNYRVQELSEERKDNERTKRTDLAQLIEDQRETRDEAAELLRQLRAVQNRPGSEQVRAIGEIDPSVGSTLELLDALIASVNPTGRAELLRVRRDFINDSIGEIQAGLGDVTDGFEGAQERLRNLGEAPTDEVFYDAHLRFGLSRLFRTGINVAPFIDGTMEGTNFKDKPRSDEFGGKGLEDLYTFRAGTDLFVPLGQGRGRDATAATERAASRDLDASRLAFTHQLAVTALSATQAYWALRAAQESVEIANRSVELHQEILKATQALVTGGELPQIEETRVRASAARASARLREAQLTDHQARAQLATVLGVSTTGDEATLPRARDAFPGLPDASVLQEWLQEVPESAVEQRQDLAAAGTREQAGAIRERGATTNLRPRLDLTASTWYTALAERRVSDAIDRWVGPSASVQLDFEKPLGNNTAKGQLLARQAERRQLEISARDTRRLIKLGVISTAQSLAETLQRVEAAGAAVKAFTTTIDGEVERFRAGETTLIDTLLTEQQRTDAELAHVAARQEAARLVAQLRFETATLMAAGGAPPAIDSLVTVPVRRERSAR
ncbi:MAG: TolC family protein [Vicinamibacteraceae bacterium]